MSRASRSRPLKQVEKVRRVACPAPEDGGCGAPIGKKCTSAAGGDRQSNHFARIRAHRKAFPPVPSIRAEGGPARDHYGREHAAGPSGASYGGTCPRCDEPLTTGGDGIVNTSRGWIHRACAPGADE